MTQGLKDMRIASPCSADWSAMEGDARVRFCTSCELNVYDLSDMSRREAEALVHEREGRLCVRFYRRPDGTVLTRDCPVGLARLRQRLASFWAKVVAAAALCLGTLGCGTTCGVGEPEVEGCELVMGDIGPEEECVLPEAIPLPRELKTDLHELVLVPGEARQAAPAPDSRLKRLPLAR